MPHKTKQSDDRGPKQDQGEDQGQRQTSQPAGSERALDEQREGGPRYGGEAWKVADARGDNRFGKARNDDADPLEAVKPGEDIEDEDETASASAPAERQARGEANEENDVIFGETQKASDEGSSEGSAEVAGMGRGEKPRKPKARAKK